MADLRLINVPPPFNGMNTVGAPGNKPPGTGQLVRNFLPSYGAKMVVRGPINLLEGVKTTTSSGYPVVLSGAWAFDDKILIGYMSRSSTTYLPPWQDKYRGAAAAANLAEGQNTSHVIRMNPNAQILASPVLTSEKAPQGRCARIGKYVYGYGMGGASTEYNGRFIRLSRLLRWDGTNTAPTLYEKAPRGGADVKSHLTRLFVLGGTDPGIEQFVGVGTGSIAEFGIVAITSWTNTSYLKKGNIIKWETGAATFTEREIVLVEFVAGSYYQVFVAGGAPPKESGRTFSVREPVKGVEPNTLFYSDEYGPESDELIKWQDDVSGLVNKIVIGNEDQNDSGVALAVVGQTLVIFKRKSIWALYGYSKSTFQVRNLVNDRGCLDKHSICEVSGGVYFMSQNGFEFFDGSEFNLVDDDVDNITRGLTELHVGDPPAHAPEVDIGRVQAEYLDNNYLMLIIVGQQPSGHALSGTSAVTLDPHWIGIMNTRTHKWAEISSTALDQLGKPVFVGRAKNGPFIFDGRTITPIPFLCSPEVAEQHGELCNDFSNTGEVKAIPAKYISDRINLNTPGYMSQLHRFAMDYRFPLYATLDEPGEADGWWHVRLRNGDGSDLIPRTRIPGQGGLLNTKYLNGRRYVVDSFPEAHDVVVEVDLENDIGSTNLPQSPEVYEATLEVQLTRQRRSL